MRFGQEVQTLPRNALLNAETALRAATPRDEALKALSTMLSEAGVESSAAEARLLLCAASGLNGLDLIREPERSIGAATLERLWPMARRRAAREPLSRILSQREFWSLPIAISPDVLDPRSDTETLVEAVVREFAPERHAPLRILDLGSGSGAILCALLKEFDKATAVGVDLSPAAAALSQVNLATCGFAERSCVTVGSWGSALRGPFDVIVCNPPYIPRGEIDGLAREVRDHDPLLALDGGLDGLDAYRAIGREIGPLLAQGGRFFLEIGAGQADEVIGVLRQNGLTRLAAYADLAGIARVVAGCPPGAGHVSS